MGFFFYPCVCVYVCVCTAEARHRAHNAPAYTFPEINVCVRVCNKRECRRRENPKLESRNFTRVYAPVKVYARVCLCVYVIILKCPLVL